MNNACKELIQQKDKRISDLENRLDTLQQEFTDYKNGNDLNRLLTKGMDISAAKRVLKAIADLQSDTNWSSYTRDFVDNSEGQGIDIHGELDTILKMYDRHHKFTVDNATAHNHTYYEKNKNIIKR